MECKALAEALAANRVLSTLNLRGGHIGRRGCEALANALAHNSRLSFLYLRRIDAEGTKILSRALEYRVASYFSLYLNKSTIENEGSKALTKVLANNPNLNILGLGECKLGDEGAKSLAVGLVCSVHLRALYLESIKIFTKSKS